VNIKERESDRFGDSAVHLENYTGDRVLPPFNSPIGTTVPRITRRFVYGDNIIGERVSAVRARNLLALVCSENI